MSTSSGKGRLPKKERQKKLEWLVSENPFHTDEDLATALGVSIQTIRLDRTELGLPEVRERTRQMAADSYAKLRTLSGGDVVGLLTELELGATGRSRLETSQAMSFTKSSVVRGHYLFAQANSLAVALIDATFAVTAAADIRFVKPVFAGDIVEAAARVMARHDNRFTVNVTSSIGDRLVLRGDFTIAALEEAP